MSILEGIKSPQDIKKLSENQLIELAGEIRHFLIETVSKTGGHLASNLGVVELSLALHKVFDSPNDRIIFDVGHQCYTHKIITGRLDQMNTLRKFKGISGFPKPYESEHDLFATGHSSTSISTALGMAVADKLAGKDCSSVAVIGDGALTGGMAFEALSNAGRSDCNLIIVLNDNGMAIDKNVGSIARGLTKLRTSRKYFNAKDRIYNFLNKIPLVGKPTVKFVAKSIRKFKDVVYNTTIFEDLNLAYLGPVDGHDINKLSILLERAKELKKPCLVHIVTVKGKGFEAAEHDPVAFHGAPKYNAVTGEYDHNGVEDFSKHFGDSMVRLAKADERICAITAAMAAGCGLSRFAEEFKTRFFDVGIAEEHAAAFSASLAKGGRLPVFAVYSTFLQRSYDQLLHDVALSGQKVVLAVDRAGIVGQDGETHQGIFDVSFLSTIPNMTVLCPANFAELESALYKALYEIDTAVAIRYPKGGEPESLKGQNTFDKPFVQIMGSDERKLALVAYGRQTVQALQAAELLCEYAPSVIKLNKIAPLDPKLLGVLAEFDDVIITQEEYGNGSIGQQLSEALSNSKTKTHSIAIHSFLEQGTYEQLLKLCGLDADSIASFVRQECPL